MLLKNSHDLHYLKSLSKRWPAHSQLEREGALRGKLRSSRKLAIRYPLLEALDQFISQAACRNMGAGIVVSAIATAPWKGVRSAGYR